LHSNEIDERLWRDEKHDDSRISAPRRIIRCKKLPDPFSISPRDKVPDTLLMSVCRVFSPVLTHLSKSFNPIEEVGLQVVSGPLVPYPVNSGHNFFNCLQHPIFDFLLQHSK
jgi:hypothetical protein